MTRPRPRARILQRALAMKTRAPSVMFALMLLVAGCANATPGEPREPTTTKVYVALEEAAAVAVLDGRDLTVLTRISLGHAMAHNIQVAPDGKSVWVTAPAMEMDGMDMTDMVIVIDPMKDEIVARIDLGHHVHPAHVVLGHDSKIAYVTGATQNEVIRIDAQTHAILDRTPLGHGAGAHGERVSSDGSTVWVAEIEGKCVAKFPAGGGASEHVMLEGQAVQTALTKDGAWAFASMYDTRTVARIDVATSAVRYATLPPGAEGPVQLYPTPDQRSILVADQGILGGRPASNKLYFVDVQTLEVTGSVTVGEGAHGVVAQGDRAYVTGIRDGSLTAVDLTTRTVVATARFDAGSSPNGVSVWTPSGGTP